MCGKKLRWNKEKSSFDSLPTISEDRLRSLSLSEAVIIQQRKMPFITRYYPYDNYVYNNHINKPAPLIPKELPSFEIFSIQNELIKLQKIGSRTDSISNHKYGQKNVTSTMRERKIESESADDRKEMASIFEALIYE